MAALLGPLLSLPTTSWAGGTDARTLKASNVSVKIQGTSTLHGWQASARAITVTASIKPGGSGLLDEVSKKGLASLDLVLGVDSLKSTESKSMDKNMRHDMDSDKFPEIRFSMKSYKLKGLNVTAQGDLSIHGTTKPVTLTGLLASKAGGLLVTGNYPLLMSAYGIKPPVMMFGTVKVADPVKIVFSFLLSE